MTKYNLRVGRKRGWQATRESELGPKRERERERHRREIGERERYDGMIGLWTWS